MIIIFAAELNFSFSFLKIFLLFVHFFRERDRAQVGVGQRERETQNPKQAPGSELSAQSPMQGLNPHCEIMTWAEVGRLTDWATQVPLVMVFFIYFFK